ncbi:MAG: DUF3298 domain-containing protein [Alistipes sp.]|nr:DUF3298 domain-containing protein [Alistipes sp.]
MINRFLAIVAVVVASLMMTSCQETQPEFTFDNYYQEFDTKQPFSIRYQYIRLTNAQRGSVLEKIEMANRMAFFSFEEGESIPRSVEECIDSSVERFRKEYSCDEESVGHTIYELTKSAQVEIYDRTLSYRIECYQYTGGAHGMSWERGLNYSLDDGKLLTLDDFFSAEQQEKLPSILVKLLCSQWGIDINNPEALEQMGYYLDAITPTNNFAVTSQGIEFLYDPYEAGVYALGRTVIKLPYSMIDELFEL